MRRASWAALAAVALVALAVTALREGKSGRASQVDAETAPAARAAAPAEAEAPAAPADRIPVPGIHRFAGIESVPRAASYEELVAPLSDADRATLDAVYRGWGVGYQVPGMPPNHVFGFRHPEQLAWLVANGYPAPEEVLAAMKMELPELQALAEAGQFKAAALYLTRQAVEDTVPRQSREIADMRRGVALTQMAHRLLGSGSPFAAQVLAYRQHLAGKPHEVLALYWLAQSMGDGRNLYYANQYAGVHRAPIDPNAALAAYRMYLGVLSSENRALLDLRALGRQPYPQWPRDDGVR